MHRHSAYFVPSLSDTKTKTKLHKVPVLKELTTVFCIQYRSLALFIETVLVLKKLKIWREI